jgi:YegS/Rv2252/BmrU family lipid kinase
MTMATVRVIVNPRAGRGLGDDDLHALRQRFVDHGLRADFMITAAPGHATELARVAREVGAEVVAVVGGDGTMNEVVQAYIDADGKPIGGPALAIVPVGTGGDFRRTVGLGRNLDEAVGRIRYGSDHPTDLGLLRFTKDDGTAAVRAFLNVASCGLGGRVDRIVNASGKRVGGTIGFFLGTVEALTKYRNQPVRVVVDGEVFHEGRIVNVAIANGRYFGGGMCIAPMADPTDGRFEIVVMGDFSALETLAFARSIYQGAHLGHARVHVTHGARIELEPLASAPVLINCDGEAPGRLPAHFTLVHHAVNLRH